jgi:hypothetical protein
LLSEKDSGMEMGMKEYKKPEIAIVAGEQGKRYSLGKEIWRFIVVFLVGSFIAGLIPAIYEMYLFLSDPEMFEKLEVLFLNDDSSFSDMMALVSDMSDGMYILTLVCTIIVIASVLVYCVAIEKRSIYSLGISKKRALPHYLIGLLVGFASFSLCVVAGIVCGTVHINGIKEGCNVGIVLLYFLGFLIQGFSEEITFRGYFMISMMKKNSTTKAVLISAFAFAFAHMMNPGLTVLAFINLMLIGIFFAVYVIETNDIWGAAAYHSMWNFAQGIIYGISVSGTNVGSAIFDTTISGKHVILTGGEFGMEGSIITTVVMCLFLVGMILVNRRINNKSIAKQVA